jgi:type IV pilus assembly protein PilW
MIGMSLVEILAAMLIGLIGMTIIMQVFTISENRKRTSGGTSDAQITGNIAMFSLEREVRNAGYGMVSPHDNLLHCDPVVAWDSRRNPTNFTFSLVPLVISDGPGGAPDQIRITYSNTSKPALSAVGFSKAPGDISKAFLMTDVAGLGAGDLAIVSDPAAGVDCGLIEITAIQAGQVIQHVQAFEYTYTDEFGFPVTKTATYNKPGGIEIGGTLSNNAQFFGLGPKLRVSTFLINNASLETRTLFPYDPGLDLDNDGLSETKLAAGVVQLQAQYGKDTNGDRIVDTWDNVTPASATDWLQLRAARLALLVRSSQFERTAVTTVAPTWYAGAYTMTNLDGTPDTNPGDDNDWRHYRYRNYQMVVPLRNMIWSTDP